MKALLMIMIKIHQRWEEKFHNKQRGNSFDDISSLEDRIAEPKKI